MSDIQATTAITPCRKRVHNFLAQCLEVKKRKCDLEPALVKKRGELCRMNDQISKLQRRVVELTSKLQAKEAIADALEAEIATLIMEWNSSVD